MTYPIYEPNDLYPEDGNIKQTNEDGSVVYIPRDPANSDYQRYLQSKEVTE